MASTLTPVKAFTTCFTCAEVSSNTIAYGAEIDVSTVWEATWKTRFGRKAAGTLTGSPEFRLEGTGRGVGGAKDFWIPIIPCIVSLPNIAAVAQTLKTTHAAGDTAFTITTATGIAAADHLLLMYDGGAAGVSNSEWVTIKSIAGSIVTLGESMTRAHSLTTTLISDIAEEWSIPVDLRSEQSVRFVADTARNACAATTVAESVLVFNTAVLAS